METIEELKAQIAAQKLVIARQNEELRQKDAQLHVYKLLNGKLQEDLDRIKSTKRILDLKVNDFCIDLDDPIAQNLYATVRDIIARMVGETNKVSGLVNMIKPGGEQMPVNKKTTRISNPTKFMGTVVDALEKVQEEDTFSGEIHESIKDNSKPREDNKEKSNSQGRRRNIDELDSIDASVIEEYPETVPCTHCGKTHTFNLGVIAKALKSQEVQMLLQYGGNTLFQYNAYYCEKCGKVHVIIPKGCDLPIFATRYISQFTLAWICYQHYLGLAVNRAGKSFEKGAKLGSDTVNRNIKEWIDIYIKPLYLALLELLKKEEVLCADATPYDIKRCHGEGKKPKHIESEPTCSQTYIESIGTPFNAVNRIQLYGLLRGRTGEELAKLIDETFLFLILVSDAFAGYGAVLKERPRSKWQKCLVHARRQFISGCGASGILDEFHKASEKKRKIMLAEQKKLGEDSPLLLQLQLFKAISEIFLWDEDVKPNMDPVKIREIRSKQGALMDAIRLIVDKLGKGIVWETSPGSGVWKGEKNNRMAAGCVYFLNNEKELRTFIDDYTGTVPISSNVSEQNLRPIAIIRNNSKLFNSPAYAESMLMVFGVFRTLEVNGIDALKWLEEYCRELFTHMLENALELYIKESGEKKAKVVVRQEAREGVEDELNEEARQYRMSSYGKDFPYMKWAREILKTGQENRQASQ